jgi:2-polyprenyl-3-methyl-5-hydroxy-6-metoxy-1,4-benzoquinol methylase
MLDFSRRSNDIEIMDDLNCSGEVVHQTLRELETINELLGGNYVTINGVSQLVDQANGRRITVADLGCGGGDILKLIRKWSIKRKIDVVLTGIDANPNITRYAAAHTPASMNISYEAVDIFSEEFSKKKFDIVLGTLFFHHFTTQQLISFFKQIKHQVSTGIVVNDIHRHWFAYYSIKWLTGFLSRSAMVKFDAPLSVLRSFRKEELKEIMDQAGIKNYTIRWMWAFRWQIVIWTGR